MSGEGGGEVFVPLIDDQLGRLSLIEALRANTDAVQRLARHTEQQDRKLDEIQKTLGKLETRMTLLERSTLDQKVIELEKDVEELKIYRSQKEAQASLINWVFKNWPGVVGFFLLIGTLLVTSGKLHL
jgi:hypothetical protein